jgi:uncharacterized delta-60 repeat protein
MDNYDHAWELALLADGRIVIAGTSGDGPPNGFDMAVWKYLPDGSRDASFGTNGFASPVIPDRYAMIYAMDVQADGDILVGGQARTTMNQNHFLLARLQNELTTSITERSGNLPVEAFPNPAVAGSTVQLRIEAEAGNVERIELYTTDGRMVHSYSGPLAHTTLGTALGIPSDLAPGIYHVALVQRDTRSTTTLIITDRNF